LPKPQPNENQLNLYISQNLQKSKKKANLLKKICPYWKDDITNILGLQKSVIYSSDFQSGSFKSSLEVSQLQKG
jgi:bisphosphoglycerate-dependent phosphoglycerate mutase